MKFDPYWQLSCVVMAIVLFSSGCERPVADSAPKELRDGVHAIGYVEPQAKLRRLTFERQGLIEEIPVKVGQRIGKGEVMARLHNDELSGRVDLAKRRLELAEAELALVEAGGHPDAIAAAVSSHQAASKEKSYRMLEMERLEGLSDRSVSKVEVDAARHAAAQASTEETRAAAVLAALMNQTRSEDLQVAKARVAEASEALKLEMRIHDQGLLRAPAAGVILECFKQEGESYSSSMPEAVFLFSPDSPLEVRAEVDESFWSRIKEGAEVKVSAVGGSDTRGVVRTIKPVMGRKTVFSREETERIDLQVFEVWVEPSEPVKWPIGLEVEVLIFDEPAKD